MTGAGPSWDDTLSGRAPEGAARAVEGARSEAQPRHRSLRRPVGDLDPKVDWRLTVWLACVVAGCLVLVLGTAYVAGVDVPRGATVTPAAERGKDRSVLAVLTDGNGSATAAALVGVSESRAVCLLAPRQLVVATSDTGRPVPLQQAVAADDPDAAARAVSGTLGVRVDDTWRLTGPQLADMVERVGGVRVDPAVRVYDGKVDEGEQLTRLDGTEAARWAAVLPKGTRDDVRLARFYAVLDAVIAQLPEDPGERAAVLREVYDGEDTTLERDVFVHLLSTLHDRAREEQLEDEVLPVVSTEARGRYAVNLRKYRPLLAGPLADVALERRLDGRIQVVVGPSKDGALARQAQQRLNAARIAVLPDPARTSPAGPPANTTITVPSDADRAAAEQVRVALGLPGALIEVRQFAGEFADVFIQLGQDFRALQAVSASGRTG